MTNSNLPLSETLIHLIQKNSESLPKDLNNIWRVITKSLNLK